MKIGRLEINVKWHKRDRKIKQKCFEIVRDLHALEVKVNENKAFIDFYQKDNNDRLHNIEIDINEIKETMQKITQVLDKITDGNN